MIRRLFWLTAGAVLGVSGYRRLTALGRHVPEPLRARELARFAADVREGMEIYSRRHHRPARPTLESHRGRANARGGRAAPGRPGTDDVKDGR
jgi:hypothetical protein